jgi:HSP20 family protein
MVSRSLTPFPGSPTLLAGDSFMELHREMSRFFDHLFRSVGSASPLLATHSAPLLDIRETDDELCIIADLPGVAQSDLDLRLEGDSLTLKAERHSESEQEGQNYRIMERAQGLMQRTVHLPFAPDPDQVRASFDSGVLTVRMPKQSPQPSGRRIEVQSGALAEHSAPQAQEDSGHRLEAERAARQEEGESLRQEADDATRDSGRTDRETAGAA